MYLYSMITLYAYCQSVVQKLYGEKLGADKVELLKESKDIDPSTLDPVKVQYVQCTCTCI